MKPVLSETWRPIPGYEGLYEVSDQGRVRSYRRRNPQILRPGRMPMGHQSVALGTGKSRCVHELVLLAFVGPRPPGMECCHNNGDPADNRLANLRWDTRSNNIRDNKWHGKHRRVTPETVRAIKEELANATRKRTDLAKKYNVSHSTIYSIRHGRTHVDV